MKAINVNEILTYNIDWRDSIYDEIFNKKEYDYQDIYVEEDALYSKTSMKFPHATSKMDLFNPDFADCPLGKYFPFSSCFALHLWDIPFILRSSRYIISKFLIKLVVVFCIKSCLELVIFS